jgi:putative ABC transport system ATP-binding protein
MNNPILRTVDLGRSYKTPHSEILALDKISLDIRSGEFLAIVGSSGSGKSTLLSIIAGLHSPTRGIVEFEGKSLYGMTRKDLALYRAHQVGMIF